jgi:GT2 family glycosyltransferase
VSSSWDGAPPEISIVVSTHRRPHFLPALVAAFEDQLLERDRYEVVVVDDGSTDGPGGTWDTLVALVGATPCRMLATSSDASRGPGAGRNRGSSLARGDVLAFTDDDCIPRPGWLAGLLAGVASGADLVQGRTVPDPDDPAAHGPWDRTLTIDGPTVLFETCNIAYRRAWFERLGGFDEGDSLTAPGGGRHFGEDVVLGGRLVAAGGITAFRDDAVVHHRWLPGSFRDHLAQRRRLAGFPGLVRRGTRGRGPRTRLSPAVVAAARAALAAAPAARCPIEAIGPTGGGPARSARGRRSRRLGLAGRGQRPPPAPGAVIAALPEPAEMQELRSAASNAEPRAAGAVYEHDR